MHYRAALQQYAHVCHVVRYNSKFHYSNHCGFCGQYTYNNGTEDEEKEEEIPNDSCSQRSGKQGGEKSDCYVVSNDLFLLGVPNATLCMEPA